MNTFRVIIRNIIFILHFFQVRRTFSTPSWRDHHDTWKEQRYNWLPSWKEIPKHLHDPLDSAHLQKLSVSNICFRGRCCDTFYCFYQMASGQTPHKIIGFLLHQFKIPQLSYDRCLYPRAGFSILIYMFTPINRQNPLTGAESKYARLAANLWRQNILILRAGLHIL